jgi:hypothetical protein
MKQESDNPRKLLIGIMVSVSICFCLQAYVFFAHDAGTGKSESNYFSTLSRFQAGATPPAEIALAGSSITGRLPGRESGNAEIANLGSDGGPALDGLRLIALEQIDTPQWLVIEANTLYGGVGFGDTLIVKGAQGPWFDVGARLPLLGASARPSAMLYTAMLRRPKILTGEAFAVESSVIEPVQGEPLRDFSEGERKRFEDYITTLEQLQNRGLKILIATYPAGEMTERERFLMRATIAEFAKRYQVSYLDLEKQIPRHELAFTDPVHLDPESAAKVLKTIRDFCQRKIHKTN